MTVLVTGATGMVGSALEGFLRTCGHRVRRLTRHPRRPDDVKWDPGSGEFALSPDDEVDAVIHLAGENIAGGRWTPQRKRRILESRRLGTRLLCEKLAARERRPQVLVSVSGVNYYATGTDAPQDESSPRGSGFLSDVCEVWERETAAAEAVGIRVVRLRLGIVLSPSGGALAKMLPAFKLGIAGRLGSGEQHMPWVAIDDVIDIMHCAIRDDRYEGAVNVVAPERVTNATFTKTLSGCLHRPAIVPVPAGALRFALGKQMAEETLLADLDVKPRKLNALGYSFRFPELKEAFKFMLGL